MSLWVDDDQIWEPDLVKCYDECMIYSLRTKYQINENDQIMLITFSN